MDARKRVLSVRVFQVVAIAGIASLAILPRAILAPADTESADGGTDRAPSRSESPVAPHAPSKSDEGVQQELSSQTGYVTRKLPLRSQQDVETAERAFSELGNSRVNTLYLEDVTIDPIPDELLEEIRTHGQGIERISFGNWHVAPEGIAPTISDRGMEAISRLRNLRQISLACRFSGKGFQHFANLTTLEGIGLDHPTITNKDFFLTISKLPNIKSASVVHADFSQPIDEETYKAIASLNGRLESLGFGEWQETKLHVSVIPAIAEIQSLTALDLGHLEGTLPEPIDSYLRRLPYLERMTPHQPEAIAMLQYQSRETYPVEFRPVDSPSGMMAFLKYLLGDIDAHKIGKEVVRRRAGLSPAEDFTESRVPIWQILQQSFGITDSRKAFHSLVFIQGNYPELEQQIRRYLSGKDLVPSQ